jgi:hypothetical protein
MPFSTSPVGASAASQLLHSVSPARIGLRAAFQDANAIFAFTNYYSHLADHSVQTLAYMRSEPVDTIASSRDVLSGQAIFTAAACVPGLQRLVWSTVKTRGAPNDRGKALVTNQVYLLQWLERRYPDLLGKTSFLYPCLRMEDYAAMLSRVSEHECE